MNKTVEMNNIKLKQSGRFVSS